MTWMDDDELEARFRELRQEDEATAPDFSALIRPVRAPVIVSRRGLARTTLWIAAAASVVIAAGVALRRADADDRILLVSSSTPPEIAAWRSPTASLVPLASSPGSPGWISTSVLDGATRGLGQLEGTGQ